MDHISQIEDKCSNVGVYCISSLEKIIDTSWMGYRFDSKFYLIKKQYYRLCCLCQDSKGKKNHLFPILKKKYLSKSKNIALDGKQLLYPVK